MTMYLITNTISGTNLGIYAADDTYDPPRRLTIGLAGQTLYAAAEDGTVTAVYDAPEMADEDAALDYVDRAWGDPCWDLQPIE